MNERTPAEREARKRKRGNPEDRASAKLLRYITKEDKALLELNRMEEQDAPNQEFFRSL